MKLPPIPSKFHKGGVYNGRVPKPGEIPVLALPDHMLVRHHFEGESMPPVRMHEPYSFTQTFDDIDPEFTALVRRVAKNVAAEATARLVTVALIRDYGVTLPLQAFSRMPRPLNQVQSLVLAKLEAIAEHVGKP